jgi:hypothetical protein
MGELSLLKRIYYSYLGNLYWFTHYTTTHTFLGMRQSALIKFLAILLALASWLLDWGPVVRYLSLVLLVSIFLAYWTARRAQYFRFVPGDGAIANRREMEKPAPYHRLPVKASGIFSLQDWEKNVLFRPAHYWQVPMGDHAVMVEHAPRKYLYQFFNTRTMTALQQGWLIYGPHPNPALAISFQSIWGPEFNEIHFSIFGAEKKAKEPKQRTIYLSFDQEEAEQIVWQNIVRNAPDFAGAGRA